MTVTALRCDPNVPWRCVLSATVALDYVHWLGSLSGAISGHVHNQAAIHSVRCVAGHFADVRAHLGDRLHFARESDEQTA